MNLTRWIVGGVLFFSLAANIALGTTLYERSKVTPGDYGTFISFMGFLHGATTAVDKASQDTGDSKVQDVQEANSQIAQAVDILMALESEADQHGLDFVPMMGALRHSELPSPNDPAFANQEDSWIHKSSTTLHLIQSGLKGTSYQNDGELTKLRSALNAVDSKLSPA